MFKYVITFAIIFTIFFMAIRMVNYKSGYESGYRDCIKRNEFSRKAFSDSLNSFYMKRFQFADSIRNACTWDGGLPSQDYVNKKLTEIDGGSR